MSEAESSRLSETELMSQMSSVLYFIESIEGYSSNYLRCRSLIAAAFDTTSSALARIMYLLSQNPDVQQKLRAEVKAAWEVCGGDLDYDALNALPYLEAVCRETLRV